MNTWRKGEKEDIAVEGKEEREKWKEKVKVKLGKGRIGMKVGEEIILYSRK